MIRVGAEITSRIQGSTMRGFVTHVHQHHFVWLPSGYSGVEAERHRRDEYDSEGIEWARGWSTPEADALRVAIALDPACVTVVLP